jgi:glycosyltransferase involved in cell wall biosynthesis
VHRYIALTEFQRQLVVNALPPNRVVVISNFLEPDPGQGTEDRSGVIFVGRVSEEKGVAALLGAAELQPGIISVAGDGPLDEGVRRAASLGSLRYLGSLGRLEVLHAMKRSIALIVPSIWYEGFPLVVLEAFATGTPVIASRIGSLAEVVDDGFTGILVEPGDGADLSRHIRWAVEHPAEMRSMGANARRGYEERYRGRRHLAQLLATYAAAAARCRTMRRA